MTLPAGDQKALAGLFLCPDEIDETALDEAYRVLQVGGPP